MSWRRQPADAATIARQQAELDSAEASSADAETIARAQEGERKTETPSAQKLYNDYIMRVEKLGKLSQKDIGEWDKQHILQLLSIIEELKIDSPKSFNSYHENSDHIKILVTAMTFLKEIDLEPAVIDIWYLHTLRDPAALFPTFITAPDQYFDVGNGPTALSTFLNTHMNAVGTKRTNDGQYDLDSRFWTKSNGSITFDVPTIINLIAISLQNMIGAVFFGVAPGALAFPLFTIPCTHWLTGNAIPGDVFNRQMTVDANTHWSRVTMLGLEIAYNNIAICSQIFLFIICWGRCPLHPQGNEPCKYRFTKELTVVDNYMTPPNPYECRIAFEVFMECNTADEFATKMYDRYTKEDAVKNNKIFFIRSSQAHCSLFYKLQKKYIS
jgi:hypothetical protein